MLVSKLLRGDVEPPSRSRPATPRPLDAIVLRGLARNPDQRFATRARDGARARAALGAGAGVARSAQWVEALGGDDRWPSAPCA